MHTSLTSEQVTHAKRLLQSAAVDRLEVDEIIAEGQYWLAKREEWQDRLRTGDFISEDAREGDTLKMLKGGIEWADHQLTVVAERLERFNRLQHFGPIQDRDQEAWRARFADTKQRDIVDAIETCGVPLTRRGNYFVGLCPFHDDHSPSLVVTPKPARWRCFACGAHGDLVDFIQRLLHTSVVEALQLIENDALGVQ